MEKKTRNNKINNKYVAKKQQQDFVVFTNFRDMKKSVEKAPLLAVKKKFLVPNILKNDFFFIFKHKN